MGKCIFRPNCPVCTRDRFLMFWSTKLIYDAAIKKSPEQLTAGEAVEICSKVFEAAVKHKIFPFVRIENHPDKFQMPMDRCQSCAEKCFPLNEKGICYTCENPGAEIVAID